MKYQCKHSLVKKIAPLCDGRLILVMKAISIIDEENEKGTSEEHQIAEVKKHILSLVQSDRVRFGLQTDDYYYCTPCTGYHIC